MQTIGGTECTAWEELNVKHRTDLKANSVAGKREEAMSHVKLWT